jgi:hypothetical protein
MISESSPQAIAMQSIQWIPVQIQVHLQLAILERLFERETQLHESISIDA